MRLHICKDVAVRTPKARIDRLFGLIAHGESGNEFDSTVNLIFTTDERMRELNRNFRKKDQTTDVLSFNIDELSDIGGTFGEIYICVPQLKRQAGEYGVSLGEEIVRLFCHGFLHLFGFDHEKKNDRQQMKRRESKYLKQLEGDGC